MSQIDNDKININKIFERKLKLDEVFQFSLLQQIIEELIIRQNEMNEKIEKLELTINISSIGKDNPNILFNNDNVSENNDQDKNKEEKSNEDKDDKKSISEKSSEKENKKEDDIKKKKGYEENMNYKIKNNLKILSFRITELENTKKEMKKIILLNEEKEKEKVSMIENTKQQSEKIQENEKEIKSIIEKIKNMETRIEEIESLDIFKLPSIAINDGDDNNKNTNLILIRTIEKKVSKKIELIDARIKSYDKQISDIKNGFETNTNKCDTALNLSNTIQENYKNFMNEFYCNFKDLKNKYDNDIKILEENFEHKVNELKRETDNIGEILTNMNNNNNSQNKNEIEMVPKTFINSNKEKMNNLSTDLKKYFNKGINDTENYLKSIINNVNSEIEKIKNNIKMIQKNMSNKLVLSDLDFLIKKIEKIRDLDNNLDECKCQINKCNEKCSKAMKYIEVLNSQVIKTYQPDIEKKKDNNIFENELSNFINKNKFKTEINLIYKKLDRLFEYQTENNLNFQNLNDKFKIYVTENDLNNMEHSLINILEEFKIATYKKFIERNIAEKTFKYLDLQIKNISDNLLSNSNNNNSVNNSDNWLLAKKPMSNFACASCDSFIGDLNNKSQYLPWNKISSSREEKKYRLGHGFSRMLQMVNMDILKNAEKIKSDLSMKLDDKKTINVFHNHYNNTPPPEEKSLPKVNSQSNFHKINISNKNARNIRIQINKGKNNNEKEKNSSSQINIDIDNNDNSRSKSREHSDSKSININPKVLKIYKKGKK